MLQKLKNRIGSMEFFMEMVQTDEEKIHKHEIP